MSVYVCGDTHNTFDIGKLMTFEGTKDDVVIIAGDSGYKFNGWEDDAFEKAIANKEYKICIVDGNHENFGVFQYFPKIKVFGADVGWAGPRIYHLLRGNLYNIQGLNIWVMGGAASIDKYSRVEGVDWWREEMPSWSDYNHAVDILEGIKKVDFIITHTCPAEVKPLLISDPWAWTQEDQLNNFLQQVAETVKFKAWFFGHFHKDDCFETKNGHYHALYHDIVRLDKGE